MDGGGWTAGTAVGGRRWLGRPFFWIQNQMFERFTPKIVFHSFTPVLHIFTIYDFYLTIYRANGYLSVARNDSHNLGWLMFWGFRPPHDGLLVYIVYIV